MNSASPNTATAKPGRLARLDTILDRVLDAAPVGMVVCDLSGVVLYSNPAIKAMLGHSAALTIGGKLTDLVRDDAEGENAVTLHVQRLIRGEVGSYRGEYQVRHADGAQVWVMLAISLLRADFVEGTECLILQMTSIERQKAAEAALAASESRLNFALESARQGVWDHDIVNDTMYYSRMWRVMRGIPAGEPVSGDQEEWLSRVHPDDVPYLLENVPRQDRGDDNFDSLEYRERKRDGSYVWILSRGRPVEWDENGKPTRTLGTDTDITRLKTAEIELAAEKERLRVTLESIADGMISTDAEGKVILMNSAAELLTGVNSAEALGRPVRDIFPLFNGETGQRQDCVVGRCLTSGNVTVVDGDMVLVGPNGIERDIRCTAAPVKAQSGRLDGAVLVFQDVTQSRAMQRELAHSAAHDDLTGLPNRAAFERALSAAIGSARGGQTTHCLLYIDLDRFKPVNDSAGHAAGDALLRQIGQTIRGSCRRHDLAARIGGDEFAVLLLDCPLASGKALADKIVRSIGALLFDWAGRTYRVGASVGVTTITSTPASTLGFMGEADAACYAAKARGRGTAVVFQTL